MSTAHAVDYPDIITVEPGKRSGRPCIRGLRIRVDDMLSCLAAAISYEEIPADFQLHTRDDILARRAYAADRHANRRVARR